MNANDATLTALTTAHTSSMVGDNAPNAPADATFDLVVEAVAGTAVGNSGALYTLTISAIDLTAVGQPWPPQVLAQAFNPVTGWKLSGAGPEGPLAGHTLQFVASLVSQGAQIVSIIQGDPFVLV